ncbi:MAG: RNA polymerase sigma factor [Planctomycetota bacterium]|jgi:RNA polymerase sigma-70 factor (ECF subfamily)
MAGRLRDETDMGGERDIFLTTHWSLIEKVGDEGDRDGTLVAALLENYWKPVYCYLRHKGHGNEDAKDLTQGFFHEVVLDRNLVRRADQAKGRFRSFLLHALNQYLINERDKRMAKKRIPQRKLVSLDNVDLLTLPQGVDKWSSEDVYNYAWLSALLDRVLAEVEKSCLAKGMELHWHLFHERIAQPTLSNLPAPSLAEVCERHNIEDPGKASNMILTVKRRFQAVLRQHIRSTVISEGKIPEEVREISRFFPKSLQD